MGAEYWPPRIVGSITFFLKSLVAFSTLANEANEQKSGISAIWKFAKNFVVRLPEMSRMTSGEEKRLNQSGEMMDRNPLTKAATWFLIWVRILNWAIRWMYSMRFDEFTLVPFPPGIKEFIDQLFWAEWANARVFECVFQWTILYFLSKICKKLTKLLTIVKEIT